jgi:hypothetical protein
MCPAFLFQRELLNVVDLIARRHSLLIIPFSAILTAIYGISVT